MREAKKAEKLGDGTDRDIRLATAKRDCDQLRWDLKRLGLLTPDDQLWALLTEKKEEIEDVMTANLRQIGESK